MSRIRILPTISALILTLALLFGGFQAYQTYALVRPLEFQLTHIADVRSASVLIQGTAPEIVVSLGRVADLQTTYAQIEAQVENSLGTTASIKLLDHPSPSLDTLYESLELILLQGINHGDYVSMVPEAVRAAAADGVRARVTMNGQYVFVQLEKGDAYLYNLIPYKALGVTGQ